MALIPTFLRNKTCIPEMDLSGTVHDVWHPHATIESNTTSTRFRKGDKIIAMIPASHALPTGSGALTEYVALPARFAVHKPPQASFADAAGCLLTGMTAHQQVVEAGLRPGHRVLVNAASGGIGTMAVQMARHAVGPEGFVVGICSARNVQLVESLGADVAIDYTQHTNNKNNSLPAHLAQTFHTNPFDAIIDTLGHQSLYANSPAYLAPSGTYSSVGIKPPRLLHPCLPPRRVADEAQRVVAREPLARRRRPSLAGRLDDGADAGASRAHCRDAAAWPDTRSPGQRLALRGRQGGICQAGRAACTR
ncbi:uncharacterized protein TrAtP1_011601 [Trichoderma atroviride]|uniref:uncharacterized protein n=1 Tax=Hypocrea atroviridis TaxID=63577 RepID=UPI0033200606|nr:hypothetical protein TrAtP1_011601 [Trichoderma atroviride]